MHCLIKQGLTTGLVLLCIYSPVALNYHIDFDITSLTARLVPLPPALFLFVSGLLVTTVTGFRRINKVA